MFPSNALLKNSKYSTDRKDIKHNKKPFKNPTPSLNYKNTIFSKQLTPSMNFPRLPFPTNYKW